MDWLLQVGTFTCERQDCPGVQKPCSFCGMPDLDRRSEALLSLYQRCLERKCLPYAGGVLDQPEDLMRAFDAIDERIALHKKKMDEEADRTRTLGFLREEVRGQRR